MEKADFLLPSSPKQRIYSRCSQIAFEHNWLCLMKVHFCFLSSRGANFYQSVALKTFVRAFCWWLSLCWGQHWNIPNRDEARGLGVLLGILAGSHAAGKAEADVVMDLNEQGQGSYG